MDVRTVTRFRVMQDYPSIPRATGQSFREIPGAYIFDKLDGNSMRAEWNRKRGWYKHGKRHTLVDDQNDFCAQAPALFDQKLAETLARIAHDQRWSNLVVYYEFWGIQSLGGSHVHDDPKFCTVFDAAVDRQILDPSEFRKVFEDTVPTPRFLGRQNWTRGYVEQVRLGQVDGVTFEGVVAKGLIRKDIVRAKAKTQAWLDAIVARYSAGEAAKLIES